MANRVLIIDDEADLCAMLSSALTKRGFVTSTCPSAAEGLRAVADDDFDVVLADVIMHGMGGVDLCAAIANAREDLPVVLMTSSTSMDTAVAAIRAGAYDFVTKPFVIDELALVLERAAAERELRGEVRRLRREVRSPHAIGGMVGAAASMERMFELVDRVAPTDTSVLITGESGSGKELVARALHSCSHRKNGPFVAINTAAMPESLLESELFGHVKGAFTDARGTRGGLFLQATGGTLFLDEIGEMPPGMQAKLLRTLQERTVRPVGGDTEIPFDARIVTATNRDLETEVAEGRFREDLYYRINVVRVEIPPLRARQSDALLLAQHFLETFATKNRASVKTIGADAAGKILAYPWPGNVRELQNCMERAVALARGDQLTAADLPEKIVAYVPTQKLLPVNDEPAQLVTMDEVERRYILHVLEAVGGNKTLGAKVLGFDRRTLYRKLETFEAGARPAFSAPPSGSVPTGVRG